MKKIIMVCIFAFIPFHASCMDDPEASNDENETIAQNCEAAINNGDLFRLQELLKQVSSSNIPKIPSPITKKKVKNAKGAKSAKSAEGTESASSSEAGSVPISSSGSSSLNVDQLKRLIKAVNNRVMRKQHVHDRSSESWYKRIRKRGAIGIALLVISLIEGYNIIQSNNSSDGSDSGSNATSSNSNSFGLSTQTLTALSAVGSGLYQIWHDWSNKDEQASLFKSLAMQAQIQKLAAALEAVE